MLLYLFIHIIITYKVIFVKLSFIVLFWIIPSSLYSTYFKPEKDLFVLQYACFKKQKQNQNALYLVSFHVCHSKIYTIYAFQDRCLILEIFQTLLNVCSHITETIYISCTIPMQYFVLSFSLPMDDIQRNVKKKCSYSKGFLVLLCVSVEPL